MRIYGLCQLVSRTSGLLHGSYRVCSEGLARKFLAKQSWLMYSKRSKQPSTLVSRGAASMTLGSRLVSDIVSQLGGQAILDDVPRENFFGLSCAHCVRQRRTKQRGQPGQRGQTRQQQPPTPRCCMPLLLLSGDGGQGCQ